MSKFAALCVAALAACAHGQTYTSCNPMEKSCPSNPALDVSSYSHDFTKGADKDNWSEANAGSIKYTSNGAEFTINKAGEAPTLMSNFYIFFGQVSFQLRTAPGRGIVSSAILQSDDLDEVDWEWLGGEPNNVQLNYFGKGNTSTYDRGANAAVSNSQSTTHNYTIRWTSAATTWLIDSVPVRTLKYADALGGQNYPQTPMNIRIGDWAGGAPGNAKGTIEWAGGETDFSAAPFTMVLEKIEVVNFNPGKSYTYSDKSGSWQSITVEGGSGSTKGEGDVGQDEEKSEETTSSAVIVTTSVVQPASASVAVSLSTAVSASASATPTASANGTGVVRPSASPSQKPEESPNAGERLQMAGWSIVALAVAVGGIMA